MTVLGVDISKWNGNWDAVKAKAAGTAYAFIKASQALYTDPMFIVNWHKAKDAGILRGAYHYLDYNQTGRDQANYFADLLDADRGEVPPVVDFEQRSSSTTAAKALACLRDFVTQLKARNYSTLTIYTSASYWREFGEKNSNWAQFPLWLADYNSKNSPAAPAPWPRWTFWQFTSKGSGETFGTESYNIDITRYDGTLDDLYAFVGFKVSSNDLQQRLAALEQRVASLEQALAAQASSPSSTPYTPPATSYALCTAEALNVRSGPGATYPVIGWLSNGQRVKVVERQNGWARIDNPSGWSGERYLRFS